MGVLSRLCSCGDGDVARISEAENGSYIRVVDANSLSRVSSRRRSSVPIPVPRHATRNEKTDLTQPLITIDEKEPDDFESPPASPYSSVVSIPSTRITALTSSYTGSTNARNSQQYESPPPSYHAGRSRSPSPPASLSSHHPVMSSDWLEILQRAAYEDGAHRQPSAIIPGR